MNVRTTAPAISENMSRPSNDIGSGKQLEQKAGNMDVKPNYVEIRGQAMGQGKVPIPIHLEA